VVAYPVVPYAAVESERPRKKVFPKRNPIYPVCETCHEEANRDYDGTIVKERQQAVRSIFARHTELGVDPDEVAFRFCPKAEQRCLRINIDAQRPRYEIHVPGYKAQLMSNSPPFAQIAHIALLERERSPDEIGEILDIEFQPRYDAVFLADEPPIDLHRAKDRDDVAEFESAPQ
jgi:hypothetical protein